MARNNSGNTLMMVLIGSVAVAGLSILVSSLVQNTNKSQANLRLAGTASDLETRFRMVTLSSRALSNTRAANPILSKCLDPAQGCPTTTAAGPQPIEIRDAANGVLIPLVATGATVISDDGGNICNPPITNPSCRWKIWATLQPLGCPVAGCKPNTFDIFMGLEYHPLANTPGNVPMSARSVSGKALPKELFTLATSSTDCATGEVMTGIAADGSPACRPVSAADLVPSVLGAVGACPNGKYFAGFDAAGARDCRDLPASPANVLASVGSCAAGKYLSGFTAAGAPICTSLPKLECTVVTSPSYTGPNTLAVAPPVTATCPAAYPILTGSGSSCNGSGVMGAHWVAPNTTTNAVTSACGSPNPATYSTQAICCRIQ